MPEVYANDFSEILITLAQNDDLRQDVLNLIASEPMPGKVIEGGNRLTKCREILSALANNEISLTQSYAKIANELPRSTSLHSANI